MKVIRILIYACEILAQLGKYNIIYEDFSTSYSVQYIQARDDDFIEITDEFEKVLNTKVVEG